jgi:hypothetical protein
MSIPGREMPNHPAIDGSLRKAYTVVADADTWMARVPKEESGEHSKLKLYAVAC